MDKATEIELQGILGKGGYTQAEAEFVDKESACFAPAIEAAFRKDVADKRYERCRIRAIHDDRIVLVVWFRGTGLEKMHPPPYKLYTLNRTSQQVNVASAEDQERYYFRNYK
jgi:hypothetical protein